MSSITLLFQPTKLVQSCRISPFFFTWLLIILSLYILYIIDSSIIKNIRLLQGNYISVVLYPTRGPKLNIIINSPLPLTFDYAFCF